MDFLKTVSGKVISGMVGVATMAAIISWWRMDEATKQMLLSGTGRILSWTLVVLLVPWATFFVISWVGKLNSNLAGGILVFVYTLAEALLLAKLFGWHLPSVTAWTFFATGTLFAGVYNLLTCDWIAEKFEA